MLVIWTSNYGGFYLILVLAAFVTKQFRCDNLSLIFWFSKSGHYPKILTFSSANFVFFENDLQESIFVW